MYSSLDILLWYVPRSDLASISAALSLAVFDVGSIGAAGSWAIDLGSCVGKMLSINCSICPRDQHESHFR